ncbi:tripartite tricarboxylate transporter substrate binding protein [Azohydromonas caseinilytica]|uniref:Tripartite tricarboxylate transporter substrate binding protein n=1 Tax=Azohydromonas caseinilytica TaxID=2728836 RepID=A0A848FIW4_9BURK|nr:tripartite tricarboxylate transporter substrate binding protein [Azohydromonas caseinilytica]NML19076.1 tripartite tricarboxylate transporter substrate binding protein [Azohydromonas caseinilytica]
MTVCTLTRRGALALASLALTLPAAWAQAPSDKPIRLVVPLSAGSTVDAVARAMSPQMARAMGHPIVIENLPGAGGMTGTVQVVNAPKDGLTLGMISSNHVINPSIYKKVPFDSLKDITPISVIGTVPLVLVAHPSVKAHNARELVALMKAKPGTLNLGSAGNGSTLHLAGVMFGNEAGVEIRHIPYKGTGPLTSDLVGGQVDIGFISVTAAAPHIRAGKLRAIGLSTKERSPVLPEVPTLAESGLPNYSFDAWIALVGPAGLPAPIVQKAYADVKTVLAQKDVQDALAQQGITVINGTPEQAGPFFKAELDKHAKLVRQSGATAD